MTVHSFTVADAKLYGVEKATILNNLRFWLDKNKANRANIKDGYVWTYNSSRAFHELFPYLSPQKIGRLLRELESDGVIKSANYNRAGFDKTKWYTIVQEYKFVVQNQTTDCSNLNNALFNSEQPIPDSKPDSKPDSNSANALAIKIIDIWNTIKKTEKTNWQGVDVKTKKRITLTNQRIKLVKKRLSDSDRPSDENEILQWFTDFMMAMANDPWYSGRQTGYRLEYGQFMAEDYFVKTIERLNGQ